MPKPAMAHAMSAPKTPVACAKLRGSENTPAPTIEPTTMAIIVSSDSLTVVGGRALRTRWSLAVMPVALPVAAVMVLPPRSSEVARLLDPEAREAVEDAQAAGWRC